MWPFVDPATKEKVKFGSSEGLDVVKEGDVNSNQLLEECGGEIVVRLSALSFEWKSVILLRRDVVAIRT
jgi:hypothetical protein